MTAPDEVAAEVSLTSDALALYPVVPLGDADSATEVDEYETAIDDDEAESEEPTADGATAESESARPTRGG